MIYFAKFVIRIQLVHYYYYVHLERNGVKRGGKVLSNLRHSMYFLRIPLYLPAIGDTWQVVFYRILLFAILHRNLFEYTSGRRTQLVFGIVLIIQQFSAIV